MRYSCTHMATVGVKGLMVFHHLHHRMQRLLAGSSHYSWQQLNSRMPRSSGIGTKSTLQGQGELEARGLSRDGVFGGGAISPLPTHGWRGGHAPYFLKWSGRLVTAPPTFWW